MQMMIRKTTGVLFGRLRGLVGFVIVCLDLDKCCDGCPAALSTAWHCGRNGQGLAWWEDTHAGVSCR